MHEDAMQTKCFNDRVVTYVVGSYRDGGYEKSINTNCIMQPEVAPECLPQVAYKLERQWYGKLIA